MIFFLRMLNSAGMLPAACKGKPNVQSGLGSLLHLLISAKYCTHAARKTTLLTVLPVYDLNPSCLLLLPVLNYFILSKIFPQSAFRRTSVLKFMNVPKSQRMMSDDAGGGGSMVKKITCSEESRLVLFCQKGRQVRWYTGFLPISTIHAIPT